MKPEIVEKLHRLNQEFYQTFSGSFSSTRNRIQPGVKKILDEIPSGEKWLDIGCGNGNLAVEWINSEKKGQYFGIDFSIELLDIARKKIDTLSPEGDLNIQFSAVDVFKKGWQKQIPERTWDGVMMFAVLHHIPGKSERLKILRSVRHILIPGHPLYLSAWQIQNSRRLLDRLQPWSKIGLDENQVDPGDVLIDWREPNVEGQQNYGLRYVHIFESEELHKLAEDSRFRVMESFYSDGREGNLALYQKWC
jgi:tRNA (uracil-5-)-methyltransferase TRM9